MARPVPTPLLPLTSYLVGQLQHNPVVLSQGGRRVLEYALRGPDAHSLTVDVSFLHTPARAGTRAGALLCHQLRLDLSLKAEIDGPACCGFREEEEESLLLLVYLLYNKLFNIL